MKKDRLAVILTTWRRLFRLSESLEQLANQPFEKFDLFIWNNNRDPGKPERVDEACLAVADRLPLTTIHSCENLVGRGRMILARQLRLKHGYQYVTFLDDDVKIPKGMLTRLWDEKQPNTFVSQRVWKPSSPAIWPRDDALPGEEGFYGMASGSIVDTEIFAYDQYWALWPKRFWSLDDVWLSTMCRAMGWPIVKSSMAPICNGSSNDNNSLSHNATQKQLWNEFSSLFVAPLPGRYGQKLYEGPLP